MSKVTPPTSPGGTTVENGIETVTTTASRIKPNYAVILLGILLGLMLVKFSS